VTRTHHLRARIDQLADDVGRLRRTAKPESSLWHLADRLADGLESLDAMVGMSAAELVRWYAPGDPEAVDAALEIVDARRKALRTRLWSEPARKRLWEARREAEAAAKVEAEAA
jgi:hypothetical protein